MQHELNVLEPRWGLTLQSAGFGVWDVDLPDDQTHSSPQWKAALGYGTSGTSDSADSIER